MNKIRLSIAAALTLSSTFSVAGSYGVEARGSGMGGTGVVAATYLTAPFYNPALTAIYRRNDDFGMLLPSVGVVYDNDDGLVDKTLNLADLIPTADDATLQAALDDMDANELRLELGGAIAFGIPNPYLSMTAFGKAYYESFFTPNIATGGSGSANASESHIEVASVGVLEAGVSIARYSNVLGQHMSFGLSPKIQRVESYAYAVSVSDYATESLLDITDVLENENADSMFNLDVGVLWFYGPLRVGVAGTNLFSREIESKSVTTTDTVTKTFVYKIQPQYTVGVGLVFDYFTLSADYDINEDTRFEGFEDNTQWFRAGVEIDLLRQIQLRGGFKKNLAYDDSVNTFTAGVGISPLGLFELDVSASYTSVDSKALYVNFLTTY